MILFAVFLTPSENLKMEGAQQLAFVWSQQGQHCIYSSFISGWRLSERDVRKEVQRSIDATRVRREISWGEPPKSERVKSERRNGTSESEDMGDQLAKVEHLRAKSLSISERR
ncbi:hypothetical protein RP20_CCG014011 [Aedes albopictus]|nr:hypothetical protein RP20_CCG014011 [Aedes albopictus]